MKDFVVMNIVMYPKVLLGAAGYLKQQLTKRFSVVVRSVIIHKTSLCWVGLFRATILVAATNTAPSVRERIALQQGYHSRQNCFSPQPIPKSLHTVSSQFSTGR